MRQMFVRALKLLEPCLAVALGLGIGLIIAAAVGEDPWLVLRVLTLSAFGSSYDFGMTLFYALPLTLTGLSVAVAFRAGLFNIGAEGQLLMGALACAAVGILFPNLPRWVALPLAIGAAIAAGGFWGVIPGWLRAKRGSHEVITTIMLNFIAAAFCSFITLYALKNPEVQNPETLPVGEGYLLQKWEIFGGAPVGATLILVLSVVAFYGAVMARSVLGYEWKVSGDSPGAARFAGISVERRQISAMWVAGAIAGLVGVIEVCGNTGRFSPGFSPDYGFIGIAVALLGRGHPVGVMASAVLFAALHKGSIDLDFESEIVTRDLSRVIQACVILAVSSDGLWSFLRRRA